MSKDDAKLGMEKQIKEITSLCKTFSNTIQMIEYKEEKLENDVALALTTCDNKIDELNKKLDTQRSAQNILPP